MPYPPPFAVTAAIQEETVRARRRTPFVTLSRHGACRQRAFGDTVLYPESVQAEGIRRHGSAWIMLLWKNFKHECAYPQPRRVASTLSLHAYEHLFQQLFCRCFQLLQKLQGLSFTFPFDKGVRFYFWLGATGANDKLVPTFKLEFQYVGVW